MKHIMVTAAMLAVAVLLWVAIRGNGGSPEHIDVAGDHRIAANAKATSDASHRGEAERPRQAQSANPRNGIVGAPQTTHRPDLPLPPLDTPLSQVLEELEERADSGDVAAACRVAAEIAACDTVRGMGQPRDERSVAALIARNPHHGRDEEVVAAFANALEQEARLISHCAGVESSWFDQRPRLDLRAARLGDLDAALRFVQGEGMSPGDLMRKPELAILYRQNAWPVFLQLFEAGDPAAAMMWRTSALHDHRQQRPLTIVMPDDWRQQGAVADALARRVRGAMQGGTAPGESGHLEADSLFAKYFSSSPRFSARLPALVHPEGDRANPANCESG